MPLQKGIPMIKRPLAPALIILCTLVLLLSIIGPAMAGRDEISSGGIVPAAPMQTQAQGPTDPAELETFLDELLEGQMEELHIAGAAVSIVKDDVLFFAKGYGFADIEKGIPVDPESTIFRTGSIGKTFTWTAVMQLVEIGKLDLEADVNTYLDFRIPDTYPQPITLKHLLTHTSGFEDILLDAFVSDPNELLPVREWLASHMARRVCPPGECAGYSNFNAMLAGYIVARVSGQPYEQYIQEHIFDSLGMEHSTVGWPVPADLIPHVSLGYIYSGDNFRVFPDYIPQPAPLPSGGHMVSATDMARFMIAHLQGGFYGDASTEMRILEETTARQMQNTLYTPDPRLMGTAYGFADWSDNGQRTLGHTGYGPPMHSVLMLLPDQDLGLFVVFNSKDTGLLTVQHLGFQRAFFDHYYPATVVEPVQPQADFADKSDRFVGSYRYASAPASTFSKIFGLFGVTIEVSDPGNGELQLNFEGIELRFVEIEPLYFRQVEGPFSAIFREDNQGRITHVYTDLMPQYTAVKLDWYESPGFNRILLLVCALVFLSMIPIAAIRALRSRLREESKPTSRGAQVASWIVLGISLMNLLLLVGIVSYVMGISTGGNPPTELHSLSLITNIALGLGVAAAVLTVGALVYTVLAWKERYWGIAFRIYYTMVTVTAVAYVWFLNYWNLLGWRT